MKAEELSKLTDQELLNEAKKIKSTAITNALLIGFMIGIIIYSIVYDTVSIFTLVPLFFIYKIVKDDKKIKTLKKLLKERDLN